MGCGPSSIPVPEPYLITKSPLDQDIGTNVSGSNGDVSMPSTQAAQQATRKNEGSKPEEDYYNSSKKLEPYVPRCHDSPLNDRPQATVRRTARVTRTPKEQQPSPRDPAPNS